MASDDPFRGRTVLLTGATGYLGKVVLGELMRRRVELRVGKVLVLIRDREAQSTVGSKPSRICTRFYDEIVSSPVFSQLPDGWSRYAEPVTGDLEKPRCGLDEVTYHDVCQRVTHIIHSAACVRFDLPLSSALAANVQGTLNVLRLAQSSPCLERLIYTSTAYVTPHDGGSAVTSEKLASLGPWDNGSQVIQDFLAGEVTEQEILRKTGHPNTYTLTKCIAEHMLWANRQAITVTICRPSIIGPSLQRPWPGWTENLSALSAVLFAVSHGVGEKVMGNAETALNVVPVDFVADFLLKEAFADEGTGSSIAHCVASTPDSIKLKRFSRVVSQHFQQREPVWSGIQRPLTAHIHSTLFEHLPSHILRTSYHTCGLPTWWRQAERANQQIAKLNESFAYFLNRSYDFVASRPTAFEHVPQFSQDVYIRLACRGVQQYVLRKKRQRGQVSTEAIIAGREMTRSTNNTIKLFQNTQGSWIFRLTAIIVEKVLGRIFDKVTIDEKSFYDELETFYPTTENDRLLLLPSHRSYLDFVLCPYVFYTMPHLGIKIPRIAAQSGFGSIPILSGLLPSLGAFFVQRGLGKPDPKLDEQLRRMVEQREDILFFVEGQRSRNRLFLPPRRGLLKSLQSTGRTFNALPISISYERIPEEEAFLAEEQSQQRAPMRLASLLWWTVKVLLGRVKLGRVHIKCGRMQTLEPQGDVQSFCEDIVHELQENTTITSYHLETFMASPDKRDSLAQDAQMVGIESVDKLRELLRARGVGVLDGCLHPEGKDSGVSARALHLQNQWIHRLSS